MQTTTKLGAKLTLTPAPMTLGKGKIFRMEIDTRQAEVYLDPETIEWMIKGLKDRRRHALQPENE